MVLLLRADIQDDVGDRQQAMELLAIREVVAVEVRRVHDDLVFESGPIVRRQPAMPQRRVEPVRLDRLVVIDDRVAGGRPCKRSLGDASAGERVEQR